MLTRLGLVLLTLLLVGCDSSRPLPTPTNSVPVESATVRGVQEVIASEIGLKQEEIGPELTFQELGVDGLDFARIINETQSYLGVVISTEKLAEVTGEMDPKQMPAKLTVRQLAEIVEAAQAAAPAEAATPDPDPTPQ